MQIVLSWIKGDQGYKYRYTGTDIADKYLRLQIENNLRLGFTPIIATNWEFEWMSVKSIMVPIHNTWSSFANKMPILKWLIDEKIVTEDICYHDCDVYTLLYHNFPIEVKDVGMVKAGLPNRSKPQGGVVYFSKSSYDIINQLATEITERKVRKEESFLPGFYKREEYKNRFVWLNYRYNLFRQGQFSSKWRLTEQPVINMHFKFEYPSCTDVFVEGKNKFNIKVLPPEIKEMAVKYDLFKTI